MATSCDTHLYPFLALAWVACALRAAGAGYAAFHAGAGFGSGATLALMAVVAIPVLLLRRTTG